MRVYLAERQGYCTRSEEIRAGIPGNVIQGVELFGDFWDGG